MPVFYLCKKECFLPTNLNTYLKGVSLVRVGGSTIKDSPTQKYLYDYFKGLSGNGSGYSFLIKDPSVIYGNDFPNVPIYVNVVKQGEEYYINYSVFYGFNGWYYWRNTFIDQDHFRCQDGHTSDLERITVNVSSNGDIKRILYGRHGSAEDVWREPKEIEFEEGHPVVYIAWRGHGCYTKSGEWNRPVIPFNKAPDYCCKDIRWFPKDYVYLFKENEPGFDPESCGITVYNGDLGFHFNDEDSTGIGCRHMECDGLDANKVQNYCDAATAPRKLGEIPLPFSNYSCLQGFPIHRYFTTKSATNSWLGHGWFNYPQNQKTGTDVPYQ
jgi:hypothetical protein